jgi:hypothetical protein
VAYWCREVVIEGGGVDKWSKGSILNRIATQGDQTAGWSGY